MAKPSWTIRRRIIVSTLVWCAGMVTYLAIWGRDINLSEAAINGCLLLMASVIGSYVFGAVWDDKGVGVGASTIESYQKTTIPPPEGGPVIMPDPPGSAE